MITYDANNTCYVEEKIRVWTSELRNYLPGLVIDTRTDGVTINNKSGFPGLDRNQDTPTSILIGT